MNAADIATEIAVEIARMQREAIARVAAKLAAQNKGEAFHNLPNN